MKAKSRRIIRRKRVQDKTGISCSGIYARLKPNPKRPKDYDPSFPKPISLGAKSVGWVEDEVDAWIDKQINLSRQTDDTDSEMEGV